MPSKPEIFKELRAMNQRLDAIPDDYLRSLRPSVQHILRRDMPLLFAYSDFALEMLEAASLIEENRHKEFATLMTFGNTKDDEFDTEDDSLAFSVFDRINDSEYKASEARREDQNSDHSNE